MKLRLAGQTISQTKFKYIGSRPASQVRGKFRVAVPVTHRIGRFVLGLRGVPDVKLSATRMRDLSRVGVQEHAGRCNHLIGAARRLRSFFHAGAFKRASLLIGGGGHVKSAR